MSGLKTIGAASSDAGSYARVQVAFGFRTALQIHRSLRDQKLKAFDAGLIDEGIASGNFRRGWASSEEAPPHRGIALRPAFVDRFPQNVPESTALEGIFQGVRESLPSIVFDEPAHLVIRSCKRRRATKLMIPHMRSGAVPRRSLLRLTEAAAVVSEPLALCQVASGEEDPVRLLKLLWEACGTYCTQLTGLNRQCGALFDINPLVSTRALETFCAKSRSLDGSARIASVMRYVADGSASPRETELALLLGLPERYGGYGLGIPLMNWKVDSDERAYAISGKRSFRCDLCWPDARIDVEYQSDLGHRGEEKRIEDSRRFNALASMGWDVIGVTNAEATNLHAMDAIAGSVRRRLGKRARTHVADVDARRIELRHRLGLSSKWW